MERVVALLWQASGAACAGEWLAPVVAVLVLGVMAVMVSTSSPCRIVAKMVSCMVSALLYSSTCLHESHLRRMPMGRFACGCELVASTTTRGHQPVLWRPPNAIICIMVVCMETLSCGGMVQGAKLTCVL